MNLYFYKKEVKKAKKILKNIDYKIRNRKACKKDYQKKKLYEMRLFCYSENIRNLKKRKEK